MADYTVRVRYEGLHRKRGPENVQPTRHSNTLSRLSRCAMYCLDRV